MNAKQKGLSLLEILIAIAIGLIIMLGIVQVLTSSNIAYRTQNEVDKLQQNGQFIFEFLSKDVRNGGFWGCITNLGDVSNQLNSSGSGYSAQLHAFNKIITGTQSNGSGIVTAADSITISSVMTVNGGLQVQAPYGPGTTAPVKVMAGSGLSVGNIVFVSDCDHGDIFQITSVGTDGSLGHAGGVGSPGNITGALSRIYDNKASVYKTYTHTYTIVTDASGIPGLNMTNASGSKTLVSNVIGMVILYGEDTDGDGSANRYVRAGSVSDMDKVVSLRINLLLRSEKNNLTIQPQTYTFNGQTITATDNRLYRVYTGTIVLRSRSI